MNLIDVMQRFPDQASCIAFLEHVRWKGTRNARTVKARNSRLAHMKLKLDVSDAGIAKSVRLLFVCYTGRCFTARKYRSKSGFLLYH